MKLFEKTSKSLYFLLACGLFISIITPDRFTSQASAEPASMATVLTVGLKSSTNAFGVLAAGVCCLGWLLSRDQNNTVTTNASRSASAPTIAQQMLQEQLFEGRVQHVCETTNWLDRSLTHISDVGYHPIQPDPNAAVYLSDQKNRYCGIQKEFTSDPLWATLSAKDKQYIANSPVQKAIWNTYLGLRQNALERVAVALGLTKKQVTYSVKKIMYAALSKGGVFFSPIDRPDILASVIHEASLSTKESKRIFELLFAKNGVLTSISGVPQLRDLVVNSSIFDSKNSGTLIALNQLGNYLIRHEIEVSDYAMSRLVSWLHDTLKEPPVYDQKTSRSMFARGCNALVNNNCKVLLQVPELNKRYHLRDKWNSKRLVCQRKILQSVDTCLSVVDGLTLTPALQQKLEHCIAKMVQAAREAKHLMDSKHYAFAETYMDRQMSSVIVEMQNIIEKAGGEAVFSKPELESFVDYDANAIAVITDYFTQNPHKNSSDLITDILKNPSLLQRQASQKTRATQANHVGKTTQSVQKTDEQTVSISDQDSQKLYQSVCAQQADRYQKGLDQYGNQLTDAQRTRFQNRRDAFLEVCTNPNHVSEYTYTLPAETQKLFHLVGINIDQFMRGSGDAFEILVRNEQAQIADKFQEYSTQMPEGMSRDFVLREILTNVRHATALQQCGLHQLSLMPIDSNWMLIDSIDQYGFSFIDQSFIQDMQADQINAYSIASGVATGVSDCALGLTHGACDAVKSIAHLIGAALHDPIGTIKTSASLVHNIDAVLDAFCKSIHKRVRGATVTLLACGVPESHLRDQLVHWSEQEYTEARVFAQEARERLQAVADNKIVRTIHAVGNHLIHDGEHAGVSIHNILYGLCCMEAACETYDKDHALRLFKQGEKLFQENLPSLYDVSHFAGEMLAFEYGPVIAKKIIGAGYKTLAGELVAVSPNKKVITAATETELLASSAASTSEKAAGKQIAVVSETKIVTESTVSVIKKTAASGAESRWICNGEKFGLEEYRAAKLADNSFKLGNVSKSFMQESVVPQLREHCELWEKKFAEFMDANPKALKLLSSKVKRQVKNKFDWFHMFVPELKRGGVSGYHLIDYVPEGVIKIVKEYEKSIDIIVGVENTVERLFTTPKTLFLPGTTEQEVIELFHDVCMNLDKWAELNGGSRVVRSKKISGQCYEIIVDRGGEIKTFYPTNQEWRY